MTAPAWAVHLPAGVDPTGVDLLARRSLPAAWSAHWRTRPDRQVLRDPSGRWITGGELDRASTTVAGRLHGVGLRSGQRLLLSAGASAELVAAYVAALRLGLVVVPANPALTEPEMQALLAAAAPAAAVVEDDDTAAIVRRERPDIPVTGVAVDLPDAPAPDLDRADPGDPALLPFTSGTTGTPKGVVLSHANLLSSAEAVLLAWRWTDADRLVLCLPLFHMHGLGVGIHGTLLAGASAVLARSFDPEWVLSEAAEATMFFGVPTMYSRLAAAEGAERLGHLRLCVSGSAPMSAELHDDVRRRCGQIVLERYGMTETVMLVSNPYDGERRPGTVGLPLPGVDVRLAEPTGEIQVRGPNVFSGYLDRPEANAEAFTADGWFRTGDVGSVDDDGYLRIVGRAKELIITGGYNVYPREVEDVLRLHPAVTDAAVVGTPSPEWGEIVTAYLEGGDDLDPDEVGRWAAGRLAPYKRPRLLHRVDALPRNKLGKILRHRLPPSEAG